MVNYKRFIVTHLFTLAKDWQFFKTVCPSLSITSNVKSAMASSRDNFSEKELMTIASVLDCTYYAGFTMNDTGEEI